MARNAHLLQCFGKLSVNGKILNLMAVTQRLAAKRYIQTPPIGGKIHSKRF
jgi:hypothetical protein